MATTYLNRRQYGTITMHLDCALPEGLPDWVAEDLKAHVESQAFDLVVHKYGVCCAGLDCIPAAPLRPVTPCVTRV
jgi:hypothetical protein